MTDTTLGQRIAERRKLLGLSQEGFGEKMGVSRQAISKWEADTSIPEVEKLITMSKLFGVSVDWLLGNQEKENDLAFQMAAAFRVPQPEPPTPEPPAQEPTPEPPAPEPQEKPPARNWLNIVCVAVAVVSLVLSILSMNRREKAAETIIPTTDAALAEQVSELEGRITSMEEQIVAFKEDSDRYVLKLSGWLDDMRELELEMDAMMELIEKMGKTETPPEDTLPTYNGLTSWSMKAQLADSLDQVTVSFSAIPSEELKGIQFIAEVGGETVKTECTVSDDTYSAKLNLSPANGYRYLLKLKHIDGTEERITLEGHGLANLTKPSTIAMNLVEWEEDIFNDNHNEESFWIGWQEVFLRVPGLQINHYHNGVPLEQKTLADALKDVDLNGQMVHFKVTTFSYKLPYLLDGDQHELRLEGTLTVNGVANEFSFPLATWVIENQTVVRQ